MNVNFVNLSYLGNVTSVLGGVNDSDTCIHFDNDGLLICFQQLIKLFQNMLISQLVCFDFYNFGSTRSVRRLMGSTSVLKGLGLKGLVYQEFWWSAW